MKAYEVEVQELINENKSLKSELRSSVNELKYLKDAYDDLEQYTRRECLKIKGIPLPTRSKREDTNNIVIKVADKVGVRIVEEDISVSHRLPMSKSYKGQGRTTQTAPIIVKFVRRDIKEKFYKASSGVARGHAEHDQKFP